MTVKNLFLVLHGMWFHMSGNGGGDVNGLQNTQLYIHIFLKKLIRKACSHTRCF